MVTPPSKGRRPFEGTALASDRPFEEDRPFERPSKLQSPMPV